MIIVKTNTGTHFINEKQIKQVWHDKENAKVFGTNIDGTVGSIDQVDAVTFVSDTQAMEFHDDGNIIEEMKAKIKQMEAATLATILKTESECNAKIEKAEAENADLKKENEKLQDWVVRLQKKLREFGCKLERDTMELPSEAPQGAIWPWDGKKYIRINDTWVQMTEDLK